MNDSVPQEAQKPKKTTRRFGKKQWLIVAVVLVLLLAAGGVTAWLLRPKQAKEQAATVPTVTHEQANKLNSTIDDAQQLANNGKLSEAASAYDKAAASAQSPYEKSILLMSKATLSFNDGKYDDALTIAKQAEAANENETVDSFLAQIYVKKGDKTQAIAYYKKAIALIDKSRPMAGSDIQYYQSQIDALGGGK